MSKDPTSARSQSTPLPREPNPTARAAALCDAAPVTLELVDSLNLAVTILGGLTGFGVVIWLLPQVQADIGGPRTDLPNLRSDFRGLHSDLRGLRSEFQQLRDENAQQHAALIQRIYRLIGSRID